MTGFNRMMGVSALALAAFFVGGAAVAGTLENVKARGKLDVGVKNDFVPYGYLNDKGDVYEATFSNLGLRKVPVSSDYVRRHPKLLVGGVWCITDMLYEPSDDPKHTPWRID